MPESVHDVNIESTVPLMTPDDLIAGLSVTAKASKTVVKGRSQISDIIQGKDDRMIVIVGPCSIHDEQSCLEYSERLGYLSNQLKDHLLVVMRVYFEKPRTTLGWKGLIYDPQLDGTFDIESGLRRARGFLLKLGEMGIPAATEFLDPIVPQYLADLVSWAAIGARTVESQIHRQMASGLSMPVGLKNSTDGNSQNAVDALIATQSPHAFFGIDRNGSTSAVLTRGNPDGHVILRGGRNGANFEAKAISKTQTQLAKAGLAPNVMIDCSHANSEKDYRRQANAFMDAVSQRLDGNKGIIGCMLESHLNPGNQTLGSDPSILQYGVSITDACIGWQETESLLVEASEILSNQ